MFAKSLVFTNVAIVSFFLIILFDASCSTTPEKAMTPIPDLQITVMEIDTGVDQNHILLKDYIDTEHSVDLDSGDTEGHGTHVAGLILYGESIGKGNAVGLCSNVKLVSCPLLKTHMQDIPYCLELAKKLNIKYINISGGGAKVLEDEKALITELDRHGTLFVMAAGNEHNDIDMVPYYPASYQLMHSVVVGNGVDSLHRNDGSNWGKDVVWENGHGVRSTAPGDSFAYMTGTSQAAPIRMHKILQAVCSLIGENKLAPVPNK